MIKKKIEQVLLLHFYAYFRDRTHLDAIVEEIANEVRGDIVQTINSRFGGVPS